MTNIFQILTVSSFWINLCICLISTFAYLRYAVKRLCKEKAELLPRLINQQFSEFHTQPASRHRPGCHKTLYNDHGHECHCSRSRSDAPKHCLYVDKACHRASQSQSGLYDECQSILDMQQNSYSEFYS